MFHLHTVVTPRIDYERCRACKQCAVMQECRFKALVRIDRDEPPAIDASRCNGCNACVAYCPFEAIVAST